MPSNSAGRRGAWREGDNSRSDGRMVRPGRPAPGGRQRTGVLAALEDRNAGCERGLVSLDTLHEASAARRRILRPRLYRTRSRRPSTVLHHPTPIDYPDTGAGCSRSRTSARRSCASFRPQLAAELLQLRKRLEFHLIARALGLVVEAVEAAAGVDCHAGLYADVIAAAILGVEANT